MEFVRIAHPLIEGEGECALSALPLWEGRGWHQVEPESRVIDLTPTPEPSEPDRAPEPPTSVKATRRGAPNEE